MSVYTLVLILGWVFFWNWFIHPYVVKYKAVADFESRVNMMVGAPYRRILARLGLYKTTTACVGLSVWLSSLAEATKNTANIVLDVAPGFLQELQSVNFTLILSEHTALVVTSWLPMLIVMFHWAAKLRDALIEPNLDADKRERI